MIRTRDFFLFLLTVGFLVLCIGLAVTEDLGLGREKENVKEKLVFATDSGDEVAAVVVESLPTARAQKLAQMREKIAASAGQSISAVNEADEEGVEVASTETNVATTTASSEEKIWYCDVVSKTTAVSIAGAKFKEVEGARVVYQDGPLVPTTPTVVASGSPAGSLMASSEIVVLELPLRTTPLSSASCIPSDVVGIALDGSYIRNEEYAVYAVFGGETLVGYALDGFPIYGQNNTVATDRCGGSMLEESYKYYLSKDREAVLGCYAGAAISL